MASSPTASHRAPSRLASALSSCISWGDAHPVLLLLLLLLDYALFAVRRSSGMVLWHDELFTYVISKLPTIHEIFFWTNTVDMNPPLSYLLTRASFDLFGVGALQSRLPNLLGFALALVCVFQFVRRRTGNSFGLLASALLFATPVAELSLQARPYGLTLGFAALALLAWQGSLLGARAAWRNDLLLLVALSCLLLSHVFGILAWASIALAELVSVVRNRRLHWGRALAILLPLGWTALWIPYFALHGRSLYPTQFQPSAKTWYDFYNSQVVDILLAVTCAFLILLVSGRKAALRAGKTMPMSLPEWTAVFALTAMPALLLLRLRLAHGTFVPRYGATCTIGIAIIIAVYVFWQSAGRAGVALLTAATALFISMRWNTVAHLIVKPDLLAQIQPKPLPSHLGNLPDPSLPIVANSGLTFVEMNFRESPEVLSRTYYITGGPLAGQYAHATIFEIMQQEDGLFHFKGHVGNYQQFIQEHPRFYVLGTYNFPEDWLLRKLMVDGADLTLRGKVNADYRDTDLYEVRMNPNGKRPPIDIR